VREEAGEREPRDTEARDLWSNPGIEMTEERRRGEKEKSVEKSWPLPQTGFVSRVCKVYPRVCVDREGWRLPV
jgi:hypothetical protein